MVGGLEIHRVIAPAITRFLARLDPAEAGVGNHDHGDRHGQPGEGFQLAVAEAEAAIAHHRHNLHAGPGVMGADGGGQRIAQRAVGAVGDKPPS